MRGVRGMAEWCRIACHRIASYHFVKTDETINRNHMRCVDHCDSIDPATTPPLVPLFANENDALSAQLRLRYFGPSMSLSRHMQEIRSFFKKNFFVFFHDILLTGPGIPITKSYMRQHSRLRCVSGEKNSRFIGNNTNDLRKRTIATKAPNEWLLVTYLYGSLRWVY